MSVPAAHGADEMLSIAAAAAPASPQLPQDDFITVIDDPHPASPKALNVNGGGGGAGGGGALTPGMMSPQSQPLFEVDTILKQRANKE
jgi:hypothetical protein